MIKATKPVHNLLAYDDTLLDEIIEALKYENQIGSAVSINVDIPNEKAIVLVTAKKRGDLELHYIFDWLPFGVLTIQLYDIHANDQEFPTSFIETIENTAQYRDGGITTDEETLGKIVYDRVVKIVESNL